jgi:hypothetical protein
MLLARKRFRNRTVLQDRNGCTGYILGTPEHLTAFSK